jgi:hypothetical protein
MFTRRRYLAAMLSLLGAVRVSAAVLYVNVAGNNPVSPFSSWATAATNIQDAVDAANTGDEVLVTNGVYQYGGRVDPLDSNTNRLVVTNAITVESVNGPAATVIQGYQVPGTTIGTTAIRCVWLAGGASLIGFMLTNGAVLPGNPFSYDGYGAGVFCASTTALVAGCVISAIPAL